MRTSLLKPSITGRPASHRLIAIATKPPVARAMAGRRQILNFGRKPEFKPFVFDNKKISVSV